MSPKRLKLIILAKKWSCIHVTGDNPSICKIEKHNNSKTTETFQEPYRIDNLAMPNDSSTLFDHSLSLDSVILMKVDPGVRNHSDINRPVL